MRKPGSSPGNSTRIFFALLPDSDTRAAIDTHAAQYSPLTGRKVKPENYHITLLFLGAVDVRTIEALCMDCENIHLPSFTVTIARVGWWKKARILWLAPDHTPAPLADLVKTLDAYAARHRLARDRREYFPHITLMRKVADAPQQPLVRPFTWRAESFSLMQSITHPNGVEYRELARWSLDT